LLLLNGLRHGRSTLFIVARRGLSLNLSGWTRIVNFAARPRSTCWGAFSLAVLAGDDICRRGPAPGFVAGGGGWRRW